MSQQVSTPSRICYFKNASALANYALSSDVTSSLSGKANSTEVANLLSAKADSTEVANLLSAKADASSLNSYALTSAVATAITNGVSAKLDTSDFTTARGKVNAVFTAIADSLYVESAPSSGVEFNWAVNQL